MRHGIERLTGRGAMLAVALIAVAAVAIAVGLGGGASHRGVLRAAVDHGCPTGFVAADHPGGAADHPGGATDHPTADQASGRDHTCLRLGHAESLDDMVASSTQLAARDTAPFPTSAVGAYQHALTEQAAARRIHAASDTGHGWTVAGTPPECGQATSDGKVCPAPSAANGQYSQIGKLGFRTLSGRVSSIAYDPSTPGHYFISPTAGGVWESHDAGATFKSIGDPLPTQVVGAIAYDQPLGRILAGTGDNSFGGSGIAGHGLFYTNDDGATWHAAAGIPDLSLTFKVVVSPADPSGKTIYDATSQGLFRSTDGGTSFVNVDLPTSPAGYSPNCAGVTAASPGGSTSHLCFFANEVTDVIVKPASTTNGAAGAVIAAVGWRAGQKVDKDASGNALTACQQDGTPTNCLQAPQNGLYESTTGQPGSFSYMTPGGSSGSGLPATAIFGRTALAIAHGAGENTDAIYALVQDAQKFNGCPDVLDQVPPSCNSTVTGEALATVLNGLFASYDFGKTWTKIMDSNQLKDPGTNSALLGQPGYGPGVQGWYNLWVEADPVNHDANGDPTRVMFGLEEIWENNQVLNSVASGGSSGSVLATPYTTFPGGTPATDPWVVVGRYWNACGAVNTPVPCNVNPVVANPTSPGSTTHPDQHAYAMIPDGSGGETLLAGSDGGVFAQHIATGGDFSNDNWGDGLNRTISAVQPYDAEMSKDGTIVSGLQDNGEMKTSPNGAESEIFGGDAFYTTIDPAKSDNIIEEYTYGALSLTNDGGNNWLSISPTGSDPTGTAGAPCSSSTALFATPIEQDPTMGGHILVGCTQVQETTDAYTASCADPSCSTVNPPTFNTVFDLSTLPSPNGATNIPSALALRGANAYVGYCGYCDPAVQKVPFANGIATNVGGSKPPKMGTSDGWHKASAYCAGCGTANGRLPQRYITSIQIDPNDPSTVYVTLGGYGRRWIPPGSFGEDVSNVGTGHLFVSRDAGEHFTDITGNLPDISANWTTFRGDHLVVATDLGVFVDDAETGTSCQPTYSQLGTGLPNVPVFTVRNSPADPNKLLIATYGRGDWFYDFGPNASTATGTQDGPNCATASTGGGVTGGPGGRGGRGGTGGKGARCPKASGRLTSRAVGPIRLGLTRRRARALLPRYTRYHNGFDNFCLAGGPGIRVAYAASKLTRTLPKRARAKVAGTVVLIMTANRRYSYRGIRPGANTATALRAFGRRSAGPFAIAVNRWYALRVGSAVFMLKTRGGAVQEIGIASPSVAGSRTAERRLLRTLGA